MSVLSEENRIKDVYKGRDREVNIGFGSLFDIISSFYRDKALYKFLKNNGIDSLKDKKIIDFGCGTCGRLRELTRFGAVSENLYGVDLSEKRIAFCHDNFPSMNVNIGSCTNTDFPDDYFDIVINSTMMSSILDDQVAHEISGEMYRVLNKKSGAILWYDMRVNNPWNKNVRGYSKKDIKVLFPESDIVCKSISLPNR